MRLVGGVQFASHNASAHQLGGCDRDKEDRDQVAGDHGKQHGHCQWSEQELGEPGQEDDRKKDDNEGDGRNQQRH